MSRSMLILSALLSSTLIVAAARAEDVKNLGANPSHDELIQALTPDAAQPHFRGIRVLNTKPGSSASGGGAAGANAAPQQAPAVSVAINFAYNSADLTPQSKQTIHEIAQALGSQQLASYRFRLEGHTDSSGNPNYNLDLSKRRAEAVRSVLVAEYKIDPSRLDIEGKGSAQPLDPAHPADAVNRRVQIVNLGQ